MVMEAREGERGGCPAVRTARILVVKLMVENIIRIMIVIIIVIAHVYIIATAVMITVTAKITITNTTHQQK